jgi:predicted DNA binding CopG/RHH family protein
MSIQDNDSDDNVLTISVSQELLRALEDKGSEKDISEELVIQRCLHTGLRLGEMDSIFHKKMIAESAFQKQLVEAYGDKSSGEDRVSDELERLRELSDRFDVEDNKKVTMGSKKDDKILKVRVDGAFYDEIKSTTDRLGLEISTFVRYCIRTGMYLEGLNRYLQLKRRDNE